MSFESPRRRQLGTLIKYNRKTETVLGDDGQQWRVSPGQLSPIKNVSPEPSPANKSAKNKIRLR